ncbi:hypothetical protein FB562_1950 [Homoserinimonas aerilata]|uniref:Uncharacterized protein n=1 Tax=Homoserinimonas aerilata TaxID=1162970 RepID=A0A542YLM5_9MICO|nr:hypothetical protein [Homoserinimonas aerilata]TQL48844.1 hypothetical protein FB562_1950 [Homoserinimonas aerilata]
MSKPVFVPAELRQRFVPVIASLPVTFSMTEVIAGSIHLVDGGAPDWPDRVHQADASGAIGVVLLDPAPALGTEEMSVATPVVVAQEWRANPVWAEIGPWQNEFELADTIQLHGVLGRNSRRSLDAAILDALSLVASLLGEVTVHASGRSNTAAWLEVDLSGMPVHIDIVASPFAEGGLRFEAYAPKLQHLVELASDATAAPARTLRIDGEGAASLPTIYENAPRASLRRIARVVDGVCRSDDLARLNVAITQLNQLKETSSDQ